MPQRENQFTVYDVLEKKGYFRYNPANRDSIDRENRKPNYQKAEYPKMLYEPEGKQRITVPAEIMTTAFGPRKVGEQREIISKIVNSPEEEAELRAKGWHDLPAKAIAAAQDPERPVPPISSEERTRDLEAEIQALQAELAQSKANEKQLEAASTKPPGAPTPNALAAKLGGQG